MKKARILALALCGLLLLSACTSNSNNNNEQEIEDIVEIVEPREGGTLNLSVTRFNTLNPLFNKNYSVYQLHHLIYEGLITFNENMDTIPLLAQNWIVAPDGQSVDITIREGVKWHDGEPFKAEDVIFTIDLIKGNIRDVRSRTIFTTSLQQISDARIIESNKIRITFTRPFSNILEVLTFPILPKHQLTKDTIKDINTNNFNMVGTGPFKVEKYESTRRIELARNEDYWKRKPYIEKINVVIVPDEEAQLSLFENMELDIVQPHAIDIAKYLDNNTVNLYEFVSGHFEFLGFNFRNFVLRDSNVRRAIAHSINRHKIVSDIYLQHGTIADVPILPSSWLYDENSIQIGQDINYAQQLLEESGFRMRDNSIRANEDGTPLRFRLLVNKDNILRERKAIFIQEELSKVGIAVEIVLLDWDRYQSEVTNGNYDIVLGGWELSFIPDLSFAFHSTQIGRTNFIYYNNEEMDSLIESAFRAPNKTDKQQAYHELQSYITEELPYFTLFFKNYSILRRKNIRGKMEPNFYNVFSGIEEWFIVE